jgi:hypothetical protein
MAELLQGKLYSQPPGSKRGGGNQMCSESTLIGNNALVPFVNALVIMKGFGFEMSTHVWLRIDAMTEDRALSLPPSTLVDLVLYSIFVCILGWQCLESGLYLHPGALTCTLPTMIRYQSYFLLTDENQVTRIQNIMNPVL